MKLFIYKKLWSIWAKRYTSALNNANEAKRKMLEMEEAIKVLEN